jgi:hypothetical protein
MRQQEFTIETLEKMFLYLGCANITTKGAMDGAIPAPSLLSGGANNKVVAAFYDEKLLFMPTDWCAKVIWFTHNENNLAMSTVSNLHWSVVHHVFRSMLIAMRAVGKIGRPVITGAAECFLRMHYSEIDKYGNFMKFNIEPRYMGGLRISRIYNPHWIFSYNGETLSCLHSDSNSLYKEFRLDFLTPFLMGIAQSVDNYWKVETRFDSICPSLTLLTDAIGVKEFWKLRDVPEGKKRRAALLHWVDQHWREDRNDPEVEIYVRKHMRGHEDLRQGSFTAKIIPSKKDKLDEEVAKKDREAMRKSKTDKRKRVLSLEKKLKSKR